MPSLMLAALTSKDPEGRNTISPGPASVTLPSRLSIDSSEKPPSSSSKSDEPRTKEVVRAAGKGCGEPSAASRNSGTPATAERPVCSRIAAGEGEWSMKEKVEAFKSRRFSASRLRASREPRSALSN